MDSNHSFYFQDDWRIRPNLTLNLGVRYSNETPAHSKFPGQPQRRKSDVPDNYYTTGSVPGVLTCPAGGCVGGWIHPKGFLWNRDNNNFRPRFGLAWSVNENTVVRAGFAHDDAGLEPRLDQPERDRRRQLLEPIRLATGQRLHAALQHQFRACRRSSRSTQLPDGSIPTGASSPSARPTITVVPANYHNPYTLNWNVSIQRAIKKNYMVELSYVGMHNIGFSGNYNWNSRPWATGIDPNGKVIDLLCRRIGRTATPGSTIRRASTARRPTRSIPTWAASTTSATASA